jgi:hypothetical protein
METQAGLAADADIQFRAIPVPSEAMCDLMLEHTRSRHPRMAKFSLLMADTVAKLL